LHLPAGGDVSPDVFRPNALMLHQLTLRAATRHLHAGPSDTILAADQTSCDHVRR
jgi:hypothetical protein